MERSSGILLHISSLPSPYGIGAFGRAAYEFVDFLCQSGQSYWQFLPLGPTSYGDSPYQSFSVFAGNPYFIDLDLLCREGLLTPEECQGDWGQDPTQVDYARLFSRRLQVLELAYRRSREHRQLEGYRRANAAWLEDYALYMALKEQNHHRPWREWERGLRLRQPAELRRARSQLSQRIELYCYLQYKWNQQYRRLKAYANRKGLRLIGDIPIYVAEDSADTWSNPQLFLYDEECRPIQVAGCPPDAFCKTGQLWGNPLYRWDRMEQDGYRWWIQRIRAVSRLYDLTRIDHFRGFESYYAIPAGDPTAQFGSWQKGPGSKLFLQAQQQLGPIRVIAEDLGFITPEVHQMRESLGFPGMSILEFAFHRADNSRYLPHNCTPNSVIYTGTHDNMTAAGWFASLPREDAAFAMEYLAVTDPFSFHWSLLRGAWSSVCNLAIAQMQDFLGHGNWARMNTPSTLGGNWCWRLRPGELTPQLADKIRSLTSLYGRLPAPAARTQSGGSIPHASPSHSSSPKGRGNRR